MCKHLEALITATLVCIHALPYANMCRDMPCNMLMLWGRGWGGEVRNPPTPSLWA